MSPVSSTIIPAAAQPERAFARLAGLSIVLPCHNEAPNVASAVAEAQRAADRFAVEHEVIVVDDGSTDGTRAIAEALCAADPRIRLVGHELNGGYGAAVRSGFAASRLPWVLLTDGDLQFDLQELATMVPLTGGHDLVAGRLRSSPSGSSSHMR